MNGRDTEADHEAEREGASDEYTASRAEIRIASLGAVTLAVFTVSLGYGVVVPLLPYLIQAFLGTGASSQAVARDTGLLSATYALALFLFAPAWGRLSDRRGRRGILLTGLCGFGVTMLLFSLVENRVAVYAERFLSGTFAAAVTPVASAVAADLAGSEKSRARGLAIVSAGGIAGALLGPTFGVFAARIARGYVPTSTTLTGPLVFTAVLALLAVGVVALTIANFPGATKTVRAVRADEGRAVVPALLILAFVVSAAIGSFHVGLALRGKEEFASTSYEVAMMFTVCSVVMLVAQTLVFSPLIKPSATRWLVAPALGVLAAGLFLMVRAGTYGSMMLTVGAVATSAGVASPVITYWISRTGRAARGAELGKQTATSSLGQTIGSAAGGLLFGVTAWPNLSFMVTGGLVAAGMLLSLGLPQRLGRATADSASAPSA